MKITTDYQAALRLAETSEPVFYANIGPGLEPEITADGGAVIGRKYRGIFDENDGSFVTVGRTAAGDTVIGRDSYGAIPLFYSSERPIVSTDIRLVLDAVKPAYDHRGLAEYLSAAYLTGGKTIYRRVRWVMPDETLVLAGNGLSIKKRPLFPELQALDAAEAGRLLETAIDNSINDLLARFGRTVFLNLSGGADSTLLLAKIRARDARRDIRSVTYFHDDWRADINDWEYAGAASDKFGTKHRLVNVNRELFYREHKALLRSANNVFHTYAAAFYVQNAGIAALDDTVPIVNGSGPDESIIGTEKIPVDDLLALRSLDRKEWIDFLIENIDYAKIPEREILPMLSGAAAEFMQTRRDIAAGLMDARDFVEFQRRYHAITVLQDHIQELTAVARVLDRPIIFPYLTNDIFRIVFSADFETLNAGGVYKSVVKTILERYMPKEFVHRPKIGFQSPSRPYFKDPAGSFGRELALLLSQPHGVLDLRYVEPAVRARLDEGVDLMRRYDFLEWTAYNILLLDEIRRAHA